MVKSSSIFKGDKMKNDKTKIKKEQLKRIKKVILKTFKDIKREAKKNRKCLRKATGCAIIKIDDVPAITNNTKYNHELHLLTSPNIIITTNGPSHLKNKCTGIKGNCMCSHAEPRAIMKFLKQFYPWTGYKTILLTTFSPCTNCSNIIIDSGIINIVAYQYLAPHWKDADIRLRKILPVWLGSEIKNGKRDKDIKKLLNN